MPIYEFKCPKCHKKFEKLTFDYDCNYEICDCGYVAKKIVSQSTFQLKDGGCGWAKENYNRKSTALDNPPK